MEIPKFFRAYGVSFLVWMIAVWVALRWGAVSDPSIEVLTTLRFPRVLLAGGVGLGLAVAGATLQAMFTNPLCEPYTLGISSGAAVGAVIGLTFGLEWNFVGLAGTAFLGALVFAGILFAFATRHRSGLESLLLSGVMLGFLGSSLVACWMSLTDGNGMQSAIGWLFGDLSRARFRGAIFTFFSILVLCGLTWANWRELDALLLGEEGASSVGVDVLRVRKRMILLTSFLVAVCVSAAGMIGFVGLVVPHFVRRKVGSMHMHLLPLAGLWGSIVLILADLGSRYFAKPYELPVGVVTSLLGAPIFLYLVSRKGKR